MAGLPILVIACTFPEVATDGADAGATSSSSATTTTVTTGDPTTTTTGDPTTSSSSTGDGGAPSTTTSSIGGGGSTSDGGGGSTGALGGGGEGGSTTQSTGSAGGQGGGDTCFDGCELTYGWKADGCSEYSASQCPDFTYEGANAPVCGQPTSLRKCKERGVVLASCESDGNGMSVVATCNPPE